MRARFLFADAEAAQELHVEIAVIGLREEAELTRQIARDQPRAVALDRGGRVRQPGGERRNPGLDEVIHVFGPGAELCRRELAHEECRVEATNRTVAPLELDALVDELARR